MINLKKFSPPSMKKPRPVGLTGAGGGHKAHAIWLRKGEINRLAVRWKQVIASSFTGVGYPATSVESDNCRLNPRHRADKPNFSIAIPDVIDVFFDRLVSRLQEKPCCLGKPLTAFEF